MAPAFSAGSPSAQLWAVRGANYRQARQFGHSNQAAPTNTAGEQLCAEYF